jgi:hypothetical protein
MHVIIPDKNTLCRSKGQLYGIIRPQFRPTSTVEQFETRIIWFSPKSISTVVFIFITHKGRMLPFEKHNMNQRTIQAWTKLIRFTSLPTKTQERDEDWSGTTYHGCARHQLDFNDCKNTTKERNARMDKS